MCDSHALRSTSKSDSYSKPPFSKVRVEDNIGWKLIYEQEGGQYPAAVRVATCPINKIGDDVVQEPW
jgi:hypothetical protein